MCNIFYLMERCIQLRQMRDQNRQSIFTYCNLPFVLTDKVVSTKYYLFIYQLLNKIEFLVSTSGKVQEFTILTSWVSSATPSTRSCNPIPSVGTGAHPCRRHC